MYRRPKFLEILDEIREEMSREADYDVDLFAELVRNEPGTAKRHNGKAKVEEIYRFQTPVLDDLSKIKE